MAELHGTSVRAVSGNLTTQLARRWIVFTLSCTAKHRRACVAACMSQQQAANDMVASHRYQVAAMDMRGHGLTRTPADSDLSIDTLVQACPD